MKIWLIAIVGVVLGVVAGVASNQREFVAVHEHFELVNLDPDKVQKGPRVLVLGSAIHDFGTMERVRARKHTFILKNHGNMPLTLTKGETTCKCTLSDIGKSEIPPGETATVTLEWLAKEVGPTSQFEQTADIHTNDPIRATVRLTIRGQIVQTVRPWPQTVVVSNATTTGETRVDFRIYGFMSDNLGVDKVQLVNKELAPHMEVRFRPLTAEELLVQADAKSGQLGTLIIKSGLSPGPFRQTIRLTTNLADAPVVDVPVTGTVVSDIQVVGRGFNQRLGILNLGEFSAADGSRADLQILVKGADPESVKLSVASVDSPLKCTIGKRISVNNGKAVRYQLQVEVPKGTEPMNRLSTTAAAKIIIATNLPKTKELPLRVQFMVKE